MARDKEGHHEVIMAEALKEFKTYGFKDASIRRIAQNSGMSASGLYKHFESKEEMFAALVEPAYSGFMKMYYAMEEEFFDGAEAFDKDSTWSENHDSRMTLEYVYDNYDAFYLIVKCSEGTKYENFLHDIAVQEEKTLRAYLEKLKVLGKEIKEIDWDEAHLLITANTNATFQAIEHGFDREKAMHYADTLDAFFLSGWREFFGL